MADTDGDWLKAIEEEADGKGIAGADDADLVQHSWEAPILRSWDEIQEDDEGNLQLAKHATQRQLRRQLHERQAAASRERLVEKGMIRYLFVILDLSSAMAVNDYRPSRKIIAIEHLVRFVGDYFDQNPISHLGLIASYAKKAHLLTDLSGNPLHQIRLLQDQADVPTDGDFSLQNALDMARASLRGVPEYGHREVLVVMGALSSCDPGDVYATIGAMRHDNIRCSVVTLSAEMFVCRRLAQLTLGSYSVSAGPAALAALFAAHVAPPIVAGAAVKRRRWVYMGFPIQCSFSYPTLCQCHHRFSYEGYLCPRCKSKCCELPTQCSVCHLTLVSSPHLARSYHHLFPLAPFADVTERFGREAAVVCDACRAPIDPNDSLVLQCDRCRWLFCWDCDQFIHEALHNCPGCPL